YPILSYPILSSPILSEPMRSEPDKSLYIRWHRIKKTSQKFKEWRGIATRYAKNTKSYMAGLCLRALLMWAQIS
ncbi:MAG: hypothetical protein LN563_05415, partial [Rickettsia endosymbiont of Platyusa sonomae]|nr:hypothetical protein [Rickettsia endosymbiont of Platyusa sonomae]